MTQQLTRDEQDQVRETATLVKENPDTVERLREHVVGTAFVSMSDVVILPEDQPTTMREAFDAAWREPWGSRRAALYALGVLWPFGVRSPRLALAIALYVSVGGGAVVGRLMGL